MSSRPITFEEAILIEQGGQEVLADECRKSDTPICPWCFMVLEDAEEGYFSMLDYEDHNQVFSETERFVCPYCDKVVDITRHVSIQIDVSFSTKIVEEQTAVADVEGQLFIFA